MLLLSLSQPDLNAPERPASAYVIFSNREFFFEDSFLSPYRV